MENKKKKACDKSANKMTSINDDYSAGSLTAGSGGAISH